MRLQDEKLLIWVKYLIYDVLSQFQISRHLRVFLAISVFPKYQSSQKIIFPSLVHISSLILFVWLIKMPLHAAFSVSSFKMVYFMSLNAVFSCCLFTCLLMPSLNVFHHAALLVCSFMLSLHVSCAVHKPHEGGTQREMPGANVVSIYQSHCSLPKGWSVNRTIQVTYEKTFKCSK